MIATLTIIAIALYWLLRETDYLRIRLPAGAVSKMIELDTETIARVKALIKEALKPEQPKPQGVLLIPELCGFTKAQLEFEGTAKSHYAWRYGTPYNARRKESYQQMTFGNTAITLNATAPKLYDVISEIKRTLDGKPKKPSVRVAPFQPNLIEQVRVGSHHEYVKWNHETNEMEYSSKPKRGYSHRVENDYTTVYHDCLVPKDWLKEHEHDLDGYEPTIEIAVDSGKSISLNGEFKQGMIKGFMADYTTKARIGRKSVNLNVGISDKQK